ncbi:hypothetical protein ES702_03843 [subsurface metagenome]
MSGWVSFSIRFEARKRLEKIRDEEGLGSFSDAIDFLIDKYEKKEA